jgi:MOSC domain-containing protein YiiM
MARRGGEDVTEQTADGTPTVVHLHVAPGRRLPMHSIPEVYAEAGLGLVGDRYHGAKHRHVSVQSASALAGAAATYGAPVPAGLTRRNVTLSHGDVPTAPGTRLRVGAALLEVVRVAAPCKLLDDTIGPGAQHALRHRGGSVLRVLESGRIQVGDTAYAVPPASD